MAKIRLLLLFFGLFSLLCMVALPRQSSLLAAIPPEVKWSRVKIPINGGAGDWGLAAGSNLKYLAASVDGAFYAYATPAATSYRLFK